MLWNNDIFWVYFYILKIYSKYILVMSYIHLIYIEINYKLLILFRTLFEIKWKWPPHDLSTYLLTKYMMSMSTNENIARTSNMCYILNTPYLPTKHVMSTSTNEIIERLSNRFYIFNSPSPNIPIGLGEGLLMSTMTDMGITRSSNKCSIPSTFTLVLPTYL